MDHCSSSIYFFKLYSKTLFYILLCELCTISRDPQNDTTPKKCLSRVTLSCFWRTHLPAASAALTAVGASLHCQRLYPHWPLEGAKDQVLPAPPGPKDILVPKMQSSHFAQRQRGSQPSGCLIVSIIFVILPKYSFFFIFISFFVITICDLFYLLNKSVFAGAIMQIYSLWDQ